MNSETPTTMLTSSVEAKRWFLRVMIVSLTTCALVAVVALLVGTFGRTTMRILLTLCALAFHSGVAMACAACIERRRWTALSQVGLAAFGVSFCVLMACVWWPDAWNTAMERAILSTGALTGYYVLAIPCADVREKRSHRLLWFSGLAACATGLLMTVICIWAEPRGSTAFARATGVAGVAAFSLAHICLLLRVPGAEMLTRLREWTIVCVGTVAAMWSITIVYEPSADLFYRVFGAAGVLDASGTLLLLIVGKLRQMGKIDKLQSASASIQIVCPRCTTSQVVDAGKPECATCRLRFTIEIEEPRCTKCDYLLWQLPNRRCPECGTEY